jgi:hypothetical protein
MEVLEGGIKAICINNIILRIFVKPKDMKRNKNKY